MREAVLVDMIRTPFGRAGQRGVFRDISHVDLVVPLMKKRARPQQGLRRRGGRGALGLRRHRRDAHALAALRLRGGAAATSISATDMNKQCGSSLQASTQGAFAVMAGMSDVVLAGGVRDDGPREPDPAGRRAQPPADPDGRGDGARVPAAVAGRRRRRRSGRKRWYQVTEPWIMDMGQTAEKLAKERGITAAGRRRASRSTATRRPCARRRKASSPTRSARSRSSTRTGRA